MLFAIWGVVGGWLWGGCLRRVDWPKPGVNLPVVWLFEAVRSEQFPFSVRSFISRIGVCAVFSSSPRLPQTPQIALRGHLFKPTRSPDPSIQRTLW